MVARKAVALMTMTCETSLDGLFRLAAGVNLPTGTVAMS